MRSRGYPQRFTDEGSPGPRSRSLDPLVGSLAQCGNHVVPEVATPQNSLVLRFQKWNVAVRQFCRCAFIGGLGCTPGSVQHEFLEIREIVIRCAPPPSFHDVISTRLFAGKKT